MICNILYVQNAIPRFSMEYDYNNWTMRRKSKLHTIDASMKNFQKQEL